MSPPPLQAWPGRLVFTVVVTLILMAVSHTAYDEVPVPDVSSLIWWIWVTVHSASEAHWELPLIV